MSSDAAEVELAPVPKARLYVGRAQRELGDCSEAVRDRLNYQLEVVALGLPVPGEKYLHGFPGGGVVQLTARDRSGTYRAVVLVRFAQAILVLHVFQKKSKRGGKTPPRDAGLTRQRFSEANNVYANWLAQQPSSGDAP